MGIKEDQNSPRSNPGALNSLALEQILTDPSLLYKNGILDLNKRSVTGPKFVRVGSEVQVGPDSLDWNILRLEAGAATEQLGHDESYLTIDPRKQQIILNSDIFRSLELTCTKSSEEMHTLAQETLDIITGIATSVGWTVTTFEAIRAERHNSLSTA